MKINQIVILFLALFAFSSCDKKMEDETIEIRIQNETQEVISSASVLDLSFTDIQPGETTIYKVNPAVSIPHQEVFAPTLEHDNETYFTCTLFCGTPPVQMYPMEGKFTLKILSLNDENHWYEMEQIEE